MHLQSYFPTLHSALLQNVCRSNWIWEVNGRLPFRKYPTHQSTKCYSGEFQVFGWKNFQSFQKFVIWRPVSTPPLLILLKQKHTHSFKSQKWQSQRKFNNSLSVSMEQKIGISLANEEWGHAFFSMDLAHSSGSKVGNDFGVFLRGKLLHKQFFSRHCPHTLSW